MKSQFLCLLVALNSLANNCIANDSMGSVSGGGIVFKTSNEVSMEKEVLTISADKVRVEYEYINNTKHPIKEKIVFPMPPVIPGCDSEVRNYNGHPHDFKLWVNGQKQETTETVRAVLQNGENFTNPALLNGEDVTNRLKQIGLSEDDIVNTNWYSPCEEAWEPADKNSAEIELSNLVKNGLAIGGANPRALWLASYVEYWEQEFPPKQKISIVHEYKPLVGAGYDYKDMAKEFCQSRNPEFNKTPYRYKRVDYILTTGANWAGPIKDFTLNLKKDIADDVVSLCFDGRFVKQDDLTLSSHIKNFVPQKEISVIFFIRADR
jgi:hypothetical protein